MSIGGTAWIGRRQRFCRVVLWLGVGGVGVWAGAADALEGFEKRIRPILVEHCVECHGSEKHKGGLRLDRFGETVPAGDSGAAWVDGDPQRSRLIQAVHWTDPDLQMPPKNRLSPIQVAALEDWIRQGAPRPRSSPPVTNPVEAVSARPHWAYQPLGAPGVPEVRNDAWALGRVDRFVLAGLEARGLQPAPDAPPAVVARRLHFVLTGLPPSVEDLDSFEREAALDYSGAVTRRVDRLLASPRFGERWARHWLDVVRFAESVTLRGFVFQQAWRYRDYVIDAFNEDRPFDEFVREQLAGDLLGGESLEERQRRLVAVTFLALGNTNLEEQDKRQLDLDVVDEQLDVLGKAFLGQTFGCARCHDHKFDPIPTRDYHALAGVLASTRLLEHANVSKWVERPLPLDEVDERRYREWETQSAALLAEIDSLKTELKSLAAVGARAVVSVPVGQIAGIVVDDSAAKAVGEWRSSTHTQPFIGVGYRHDDNAGKGAKTLTFHPEIPAAGVYEVRLAYTPGANRDRAVPVTVFSADGESTVRVNQQESPPVEGRFVSLGRHRFEARGAGFVLVSNEGTSGHVVADAVQFLAVDRGSPGPVAATGEGPRAAVADRAVGSAGSLREATLQARLKSVDGERQALLRKLSQRPKVMAPQESTPVDLPVYRRGSVHNPGEIVPRGVLTVAFQSPAPTVPAHVSGRRELAEWIVNPANPLTARVYVNRVWHWVFGPGLVRSVDNFGTTGDVPSHPELLDDLARRFLEQGGSTHWLVRQLVESRTFRQSGATRSEWAEADPGNRLLGRFARRRLEAECLRDAMLTLSGELELTDPKGPTYEPGREADYGFVPSGVRRSVYLPVFRNAPSEMLTVFDQADPSMVVGVRNRSTVAPQALFLMNHSFVRERARRTAQRCLETSGEDGVRWEWLVRSALGRGPTAGETAIAQRALGSDGDPLEIWTDLVHALMASMDFRDVE